MYSNVSESSEFSSSSEEEKEEEDDWDDIGPQENASGIAETEVGQINNSLEHFSSLKNLQMTSFTLATRNSPYEPSFVWKIKVKKSTKDEAFKAKSKAFNLSGYPDKVRASLEWKKDIDAAFVWLSFLKCKFRKRSESMKIIPQVFFLLRGTCGNDDTKHKCYSTRNYFPAKSNYAFKFSADLTHKSWLLAKEFNADNSVAIEIYVEPPSMAQQVYSYNGTLNGTVDQFQRRKGMEENGFLWLYDSPYFYTGPGEYRVQVRLTLKEDEVFKKRNLEAEVCFLAGEFDKQLSGYFYHKTTFTLINREDPNRSLTKSVYKDVKNGQHYWIDVCKAKDLNDFIVNDTLYYVITVKAHDYHSFQSPI